MNSNGVKKVKQKGSDKRYESDEMRCSQAIRGGP